MATSSTSSARRTPRSRSTATSPATRSTPRARGRARWDGLDAGRGLLVLTATTLAVAAALAPDLTAAAWTGWGPIDLVPAAFLVVVGAGTGWRHEGAGGWDDRRRWRRTAILVAIGVAVVAVRSGGDPRAAGADELLRLAAAAGIASALVRLPGWVLAPVTLAAVAAPAALVGAGPLGRGLGGLDPSAAWGAEATLGLPVGGVPLASLPAAIGLVLLGHGVGVWLRRRPPGPASGALLLTLAAWAAGAAVATTAVRPAVPVLLDLPVALAGAALAVALVGAGHLAVTAGGGADTLVAVGRTALVPVAVGTLALAALAPSGPLGPLDAGGATLPPLAALTVGAIAAAAVAAACRGLHARAGALRA